MWYSGTVWKTAQPCTPVVDILLHWPARSSYCTLLLRMTIDAIDSNVRKWGYPSVEICRLGISIRCEQIWDCQQDGYYTIGLSHWNEMTVVSSQRKPIICKVRSMWAVLEAKIITVYWANNKERVATESVFRDLRMSHITELNSSEDK